MASPMRPPRSQRPQARLELSSRKPRDPGDFRFSHGSGTVGEGARPQFRHARHRGVTQFHSTKEAGEQRPCARTCGVGGGKGTDQGEHRAIATGPDTVPELGRETVVSQIAWIAGRTCSFCTSTSTVRTVCGSSARTDLCGGRSAMTVPTAIDGKQPSGDARIELNSPTTQSCETCMPTIGHTKLHLKEQE